MPCAGTAKLRLRFPELSRRHSACPGELRATGGTSAGFGLRPFARPT
ncbi:Hypothetical Protein RSKD131_3257 [Cereibacter sphaeroides KD131]|nr:Hypothetical Protein RSKD131_3257 [Cereibacter sphaeroides KD131]